MNVKTITLLLGGLLGSILTVGGAYLLVDHLFQPKGLLFEGIVFLALGLLLSVCVVIATSIGQTMIMFADILNKQAEIHNEVMKQASRPQGGSMADLISGLMKGGGKGSVIIKDMDNPDEEPSVMPLGDGLKHISEIMGGALHKGKKELRDMSIDELEKELAKAAKKDDFERAAEIKKEIESREDSGTAE